MHLIIFPGPEMLHGAFIKLLGVQTIPGFQISLNSVESGEG